MARLEPWELGRVQSQSLCCYCQLCSLVTYRACLPWPEMNDGRPPLVRELVWTMENAPSKPDRPISAIALRKCLFRLRMWIKTKGGIVAIIQKYNQKGDGNLSDHDLNMVVLASR
jgi:hypothetical protein